MNGNIVDQIPEVIFDNINRLGELIKRNVYQCVDNEDGCKLTALHVEGHVVRPINADIPIPETIRDEIEDYRHGAKIEQR
jgi:hypothetical protein